MKRFDALSRGKKQPSSLGGEGLSVKDDGRPIHRDIEKRPKKISLVSKNSLTHAKNSPPKTWLEVFELWIREVGKMISRITAMQIIMVVLLVFLAYIVYGVGFVIRTEKNIAVWMSGNRTTLVTQMSNRLNILWRDYQVIGFIAENPLIPLEPLASYGHVLSTLRDISGQVDGILALQPTVLDWKNHAAKKSIFPILDTVFARLENINALIARMQPSLDRLIGSHTSNGKKIAQGFDAFQSFIAQKDVWYALFGKNGLTRILLLNQNSDELRAGGGFPGTAFLFEFDNGKLKNSQFTDIYALDWQLRGYRPSPEGINQFRSIDYPGQPVEFEIRDANYFPLFAESARKIDELSQVAGIGKIDLVIGINQKLLEDILRLVEPLNIEGIQIPLDHTNINAILSLMVEAKKSVEGTPKSTVNLLTQALIDKLHSAEKEKQAMMIFAQQLFTGEIALGSARPEVQSAIDSLHIFDTWQYTTGDFLYPIFTSISKNKSDRFMERTFEIDQLNHCDRRVTLTQKHWFDMIEEERVKKYAQALGIVENLQTLFFIQGDGDNREYIRFVIPAGTSLLDSQGVVKPRLAETQSTYSVIDGYKTTTPNSTSTMSFTYRLPVDKCAESTYFYKQPGLRNTRVIIEKEGKKVYQRFYE